MKNIKSIVETIVAFSVAVFMLFTLFLIASLRKGKCRYCGKKKINICIYNSSVDGGYVMACPDCAPCATADGFHPL